MLTLAVSFVDGGPKLVLFRRRGLRGVHGQVGSKLLLSTRRLDLSHFGDGWFALARSAMSRRKLNEESQTTIFALTWNHAFADP